MGQCKCGFTKDLEKNCDGSHKTVKAVKDEITRKLDAIEVEASITNALGVKMTAIDIVKNS
jgi:CDGSH-type Zn-finger protein